MPATPKQIPAAVRAALSAPLVIAATLCAAAAAQPQLAPQPVLVPSAPTVVLDAGVATAPLSLTATHLQIDIEDKRAVVRTTLTYRNDGPVAVNALYTLPLPVALAMLEGDLAALGGSPSPIDDADGFAAIEPSSPAGDRKGVRRVRPGEEVTVTLRRSTDLIVRGNRYRLVLPLATDRSAAFAPKFSAEVFVFCDGSVWNLESSTHGGQAEGIGERLAHLAIPAGRAREGRFLSVEFEIEPRRSKHFEEDVALASVGTPGRTN